MKVLFTVPPLAGHVNPTVAVGAELASRGHEVAWTGPAGALSRLLPEHARILAAGEEGESGGGYATLHARWRDLRGSGRCGSSGRRRWCRWPGRWCRA